MGISFSFTQNFVYLYSHFIVIIRSFYRAKLSIFLNRILWSTVSKADFRSKYILHSFLLPLFLSLYLIVSTILSRFSSHPKPARNPTYLLLSLNSPDSFRSFFSLLLSIVSRSLYMGDVLVMGLALWKHFHSLSSLAMYIYSRTFC